MGRDALNIREMHMQSFYEFVGWPFVLPAVAIGAIGYGCKKLADANPEMTNQVAQQAKRKGMDYAKRYYK